MSTPLKGEIRPTSPVIRPTETPDQALTRLSIWAAGAVELLHAAADLPHLPDARNPERLRIIANTLADVSVELDGIADTLAAAEEGRHHG